MAVEIMVDVRRQILDSGVDIPVAHGEQRIVARSGSELLSLHSGILDSGDHLCCFARFRRTHQVVHDFGLHSFDFQPPAAHASGECPSQSFDSCSKHSESNRASVPQNLKIDNGGYI